MFDVATAMESQPLEFLALALVTGVALGPLRSVLYQSPVHVYSYCYSLLPDSVSVLVPPPESVLSKWPFIATLVVIIAMNKAVLHLTDYRLPKPIFTPRKDRPHRIISAVVTGCTSGIGLELVRQLAEHGVDHVWLCTRDLVRGVELTRRLQREVDVLGTGAVLHHVQLDLANMNSVRLGARRIVDGLEEHCDGKLDYLFNNAGSILWEAGARTFDGLEGHFGTMYIGHFLLTSCLAPCLKAAESPVVINTSSVTHALWHEWDASLFQSGWHGEGDLRCEFTGGPAGYGRAKTAIKAWSREFQRRMSESTGIRMYAVDPGRVASGLLRDLWSPLRWWCWRHPAQAAQLCLAIATRPEYVEWNGEYIENNGRPASGTTHSQSLVLARRLWQVAERQIGHEFTWMLDAEPGTIIPVPPPYWKPRRPRSNDPASANIFTHLRRPWALRKYWDPEKDHRSSSDESDWDEEDSDGGSSSSSDDDDDDNHNRWSSDNDELESTSGSSSDNDSDDGSHDPEDEEA